MSIIIFDLFQRGDDFADYGVTPVCFSLPPCFLRRQRLFCSGVPAIAWSASLYVMYADSL